VSVAAVDAVPDPATAWLLASGVAGSFGVGRARRLLLRGRRIAGTVEVAVLCGVLVSLRTGCAPVDAPHVPSVTEPPARPDAPDGYASAQRCTSAPIAGPIFFDVTTCMPIPGEWVKRVHAPYKGFAD
jgi:hypothetical protein